MDGGDDKEIVGVKDGILECVSEGDDDGESDGEIDKVDEGEDDGESDGCCVSSGIKGSNSPLI